MPRFRSVISMLPRRSIAATSSQAIGGTLRRADRAKPTTSCSGREGMELRPCSTRDAAGVGWGGQAHLAGVVAPPRTGPRGARVGYPSGQGSLFRSERARCLRDASFWGPRGMWASSIPAFGNAQRCCHRANNRSVAAKPVQGTAAADRVTRRRGAGPESRGRVGGASANLRRLFGAKKDRASQSSYARPALSGG